ncbi:MAG: transcription termination factor Rho [Candidatus Ancillula sp.]|jgi:transcription termination factor Rho|nr:transcription termination factor Rho [Candidatus Ancillula sp.]
MADLTTLKLAELKEMAANMLLDIRDLRKNQIIDMIKDAQESGAHAPEGQGPSAETNGSEGDEDNREHKVFKKRERGSRNRQENEQRDNAKQSDPQELLDVAGIVDLYDTYGFVRTAGYLPTPTDCYVSFSVIKKYGLRHGDAIVGKARDILSRQTPQNNTNRNFKQKTPKFNPLEEVSVINSLSVEDARKRPKFQSLTPLYPQEQLRMELPQNYNTSKTNRATARIIDLIAPIGKGQRALIVAPPKAGKTVMMQNIANSISQNNPEVHLMVVLVDERPEEVTDMQRSVKGEVIASTFDRPPIDHTTVAELAIERAKRLVELGKDVVILLDSITRLARAYNFVAPVSGRILSGGVDASALYPPKKFLGAARNIEEGGSLTIIASALVETGSKMDEVIFEEFKGTGNQELKLDRKIADKRIFPAVDVNASGTRREEWLLNPEELSLVYSLHRALGDLEPMQALELLLEKISSTGTNLEFLMQISKSIKQKH